MGWHHEMADANSHVPGYVQSGDPGAIGAGKVWIDTSGGVGNWLLKVRNAANTGWEQFDPKSHTHTEADITDLGTYLTEVAADLLYSALGHAHTESDITDLDKYTQQEVDDLVAAVDPGEQVAAGTIPHFNKGSGDFSVHCFGGFLYCGDAGSAETANVHPRDLIATMNGGVASPAYSFDIRKGAGSYVGSDADPTVPTLALSADDGTTEVVVYASDGTTIRETSVYVVCQGTLSGP